MKSQHSGRGTGSGLEFTRTGADQVPPGGRQMRRLYLIGKPGMEVWYFTSDTDIGRGVPDNSEEEFQYVLSKAIVDGT